MAKVTWSDQASRDLEAIVDHIARDSRSRAMSFQLNALNATELLEGHPKSGHPVPEANDLSIREIQYGSYRLIYWLFAHDELVILTIYHGKRKLPRRKLSKRL